MKYFYFLFIGLILTGFSHRSNAQDDFEKYGCKYIKSKYKNTGFTPEELKYAEELTFRSDTFDIVNYRIKMDVTDFSTQILKGRCDIDFSPKMENLNYIIFDLLEMDVDSVFFNSENIDYSYTSPFLKINFDSVLNINDTLQVTVYYHGKSVIDPSGFGGFYFDKGVAYNLGVGLSSIPHNYGRSWFPCFDNFVERSTYDFDIITKPDHVAYCTGIYLGVDTLINGKKEYHYRMEKQIPTYLAGVAASNYEEINWNFEGMEKNIPIQLVAQPQDTANVKTSFAYLPFAIEALESWYGPYQWSRVGYALTSHGAMEHPTNIAFNDFLGNDGDPEVTMGVMTHELAHHWWGDITTLTTAYDMWIKEGTAEYGWHLFVEYFFGEEKFLEVLKENQLKVLTTAHIRDDGYRALSGMPLDHTYGTTTYNKGAAVIHNLRTYMGDSLYKVGMQSILKKYAFSHLDADQFETQLEESTGLDLSCFFDDWIYSPGFCAFEIDSAHISINGSLYNMDIFLEQKLHHAPDYYCNVPLEISFYDDDLNKIDKTIIVSGQFDSASVNLPFKPVFWTINEDQKLNSGQLGETFYLENNKTYSSNYAKISFATKELTKESLFIHAEHIWGTPDTAKNKDPNTILRVSNSHFWNIAGLLPVNNTIKATFFYNGSSETELDFDLAHGNEDSITIVYRKDASEDWQIFEKIKKQKFSPIDGKGNIIITGLKAGQYAFANVIKNASTGLPREIVSGIEIYPNPASDYLTVNAIDHQNKIDRLSIFNIYGQPVYSTGKIENAKRIDISSFLPGIYFIKIYNKLDEELLVNKIIIE